jgi:tRNA (guanine-N7-)-methyltransferase
MNFANPYVQKVRENPELVVSIERGELPAPALDIVRGAVSAAKKIELELGSGSGGFILELAVRNPATLFIAIELRYKRIFRTAEKGKERGIENLLLLKTDGHRITEFFKPGELDVVYINFPDPWSKPRWKKHRIMSAERFADIYSLLKPGGQLRIKTDHEEYFDEVLKIIEEEKLYEVVFQTRDLHHSELAEGNISTEFEKLFKSKKMPVYSVHLARK